jgi:glycosyltransferase involved in cell wall biosynthesis
MQAPAVSIVIPCYNGSRFLPLLTASLERQTFRDFEVVLVDDGSTDPQMTAAIAALPTYFRVIRQENKGLPAARNAGFDAARGRFVVPLDCDDRLEPSFLEKGLAAVTNAGTDRVFAFAHMRVEGDITGVIKRSFNPFDQLFINRLPYCLFMPRSAWQQAGGYDESMREGYEDWEFNIRLIRLGYQGLSIGEPLFIYLVSQKGMLLGGAARKHGKLWHQIREKHADLYQWPALRSAWRSYRSRRGCFNLLTAAAVLGVAKLLPDEAVSRIFYTAFTTVRTLRIRAGKLSHSTASQS